MKIYSAIFKDVFAKKAVVFWAELRPHVELGLWVVGNQFTVPIMQLSIAILETIANSEVFTRRKEWNSLDNKYKSQKKENNDCDPSRTTKTSHHTPSRGFSITSPA